MSGQRSHRPRRLNIDASLVNRAADRIEQLSGSRPSFRDLVAMAVGTLAVPVRREGGEPALVMTGELDRVVELLREAGLVHGPGEKARPREVDDAVWDKLTRAEEETAVGRVELIRACLERLARGEEI